ncbi:MAG: DUF1861 family protein [Candidatus Izemoplasmatales bacterium]|nr:DUF1861 family protein [bacterium]MDZ4196809.1 DUF1861 family protein [Candidatus Izemoplasmatales bacterium]
MTYVTQPTAIEELLQTYRQTKNIHQTAKLEMLGVEGCDVYNISHEFMWKGELYIAGRIEARNTEVSRIGFFKHLHGYTYEVIKPSLPMMQDPCIDIINGELIVGGTEIYATPEGHISHWNTSFYRGTSFDSLVKFAQAPYKMKDVRFIQTDRIHLFSRPQGGVAGPGKIGYTFVDSLDEITPEVITQAPILSTQFPDHSWGGVNQVLELSNGLLGIVGHIATMSTGDVRHYYGMVFAFNPLTRQSTKVKIICERSDFLPGSSKRPDLEDVVFLGGMVRHSNQLATIYTGLSDAEAHCAIIPDPFLEYEVMSG